MSRVRAVFISHEHSDHVIGAHSVCKNLQVPFYFSTKTYNNTRKQHRPTDFKIFSSGCEVDICGIKVLPFAKRHDAADPHSFVVSVEDKIVGVMTDIGVADEVVCEEFAKCNAVFLESNYDETMLWKCKYPFFLKRRVASEVGHLSNVQAYELATNFASDKLSHIVLSHISAESNTIGIVLETFQPATNRFIVEPTFRDASSKLLCL